LEVPGSNLKGEAVGNYGFRVLNGSGREPIDAYFMHRSRVNGVRLYDSDFWEDQQSEEIQQILEKNNMFPAKASDAQGQKATPGMVTHISFLCFKDLDDLYPQEDPNSKIVNLLSKGYGYLGFGVHGPNRQYLELDKSWAACFYKQYGVDPSLRWSKFKYPKDMSNSLQLAKKVISEVGPDYIILHDDPSRGFNLNAAYVIEKLIDDKCDKMPIIYLGKDRYKYDLIEGCVNPILDIQTETLYDYCHLLANARACHMMDSSVALLLDFLPEVNIHQKRYMHEYAKVGEILSTEGLFQKEWVCIKELGP
jgi:hypothetical protein